MTENGRVTIREVYELLHDMREEVNKRFDTLDDKYVLRAACRERHKAIDALIKLIDPGKVLRDRAVIALVSALIASIGTQLVVRLF